MTDEPDLAAIALSLKLTVPDKCSLDILCRDMADMIRKGISRKKIREEQRRERTMTDEEIAQAQAEIAASIVEQPDSKMHGLFVAKVMIGSWSRESTRWLSEKKMARTRKGLTCHFLEAITKARRQLPGESPVSRQRLDGIRDRLKRFFPHIPVVESAQTGDLLAYIDHLERLVAFLSNEPEGEAARELLRIEYERGRRDGSNGD